MADQESVLVVGAGPVGALNALGLARAGVPVTLVDRAPGVARSPRAAVYHWSVLDGLERLGVYEQAVRRGFLKQDYEYRVHATGERIRYGLRSLEELVAHPYNLHLGQHVLVEVVLAELARFGHAEVRWGSELVDLDQDGDHVRATLAGPGGTTTLAAGWLIGADGAGSGVRRALGMEFEGTTWPERFVATNVRYPFAERGFAQTTFLVDDVYGAVIAKLDDSPGGGLWRYTYCEDAALPEDEVLERMPGFLDAVLPDPTGFELVAFAPYRMHQRAAPRFREGRVLLAGDAAHATNPTGGLGLTGGLFDTFVLQEALAAVVQGRAGEEVLDEYARERRRVFVELVSPVASDNKRLVYHSSDPGRLAADLAALRRLEHDEQAAVDRLMFTKSLETRSLVGAW
ncbi:MAG: monooxygenase, FAD-binding [Modestobacter sp.]|nr:monooxygenase, FAD-binding [Modestobacter sp.]